VMAATEYPMPAAGAGRQPESSVRMKRTTQLTPSSPGGQWSLNQPPPRRVITDEVSTQEPPREKTVSPEEPEQPRISVWSIMTPSAWNAWLVMELTHATPLVWGDHQGPINSRSVADGLQALDPRKIPLLFVKAGGLANIDSRIECVLLKAASDPVLFAKALDSLVGPVLRLIERAGWEGRQEFRLRRLLMTATAIAYQQGLTRDAQQIKFLAALAIQFKDVLFRVEYWTLLSDLDIAWQDHAQEPGPLLEALQSTRAMLEAVPDIASNLPVNPSKMDTPSLQEKEDCLKEFMKEQPPCGPRLIRQWSWVARHWTEPELRPYILDGVTQLLTEAAKGISDNGLFPGAFLFDLFPQDVLNRAFDYVGGPDNSKLLQFKPLTQRARALLDHYLEDENVPETERQRMREWHEMA